MSADSIVPGADALAMGSGGTSGGAANPQSLNRYSYVNNNPINHTDPSGHCIFEPLEAIVCVALAAEAAEVIVTAVAGSALIAGAYEAGGALAGATPAPRYSTDEMGNPIAPVADSPAGAPSAPDAGTTTAPDKRSTLNPEPSAGDSIPARGPERDFTNEEYEQIDQIGRFTGCHTCGTTDPGTKSGHFVPDHQPPNKLKDADEPQRLYPHCLTCSRRQGGQVRTAQRGGSPQ